MTKLKDITGQKFKNLTAVRRVANLRPGATRWLFQCDCGRLKEADAVNVVHGSTKSCGCLNLQRLKNRGTHQKSSSKVYFAWQGMKERCKPDGQNKKHYFERGIVVCKAWSESFEAFYAYIGDPPTSKHTLDRVDNNKGYEPGNVRWATWEQQQNNRSFNVMVETSSGKLTVAQACRELQICRTTYYRALKSGESTEQIVKRFEERKRLNDKTANENLESQSLPGA